MIAEQKQNRTQNRRRRFCVSFVFLFYVSFASVSITTAHAATLLQIKDTISTSAPSASANHTIQFITTTTIPASGKIIITPEAGDFTIPAGLDYTDLDLADDGADLTLGASAGSGAGSAVGVSIATGTSGSITFTLNNTDTIVGSSSIAIEIGTNATAGETGNQQITNPSATSSYTIQIETQNSSGTTLDSGTAMVAIVSQVSASAGKNAEPIVVTLTAGLGGGSSMERETNISFEGQAPPESTIVIQEGEKIIASVSTGENAAFKILLKDIQSAIHNFSLYFIDRLGRVSPSIELEVRVPLGETTEVKNILLPPIQSAVQTKPPLVKEESGEESVRKPVPEKIEKASELPKIETPEKIQPESLPEPEKEPSKIWESVKNIASGIVGKVILALVAGALILYAILKIIILRF